LVFCQNHDKLDELNTRSEVQ